jgi:DNA-directed RNA polymerase specialized sigma24 family protein
MNDREFIEKVRELKKTGNYSEKEVAELLGMTTVQMRKKISEAHRNLREELRQKVQKLKEEGKSVRQIAIEIGKNESSVRLLMDEELNEKIEAAAAR